MTESARPSGHLQVVDRGGAITGTRCRTTPTAATGRSWRAGVGQEQRHAHRARRDHLHTANCPKPDPSYPTPGDAADELPIILARAARFDD